MPDTPATAGDAPGAPPHPNRYGPSIPTPAAPPGMSVGVVYLVSLVLAGCSLLYELLIAQTLTLIAGNMVVWYSLTIGTYLAAMGVGAILYGAPQQRPREAWGRLFRLEVVLSLVGGAVVLVLYAAHTLHLYLVVNGVVEEVSATGFYAACFVMTFAVGILTGIELPLLIDLGNSVAGGRNVTNRVLGWDYIGALGGGVFFPLLLVPNFDLHSIGFSIALLNLIVAAFVAARILSRQPGRTGRLLGSAGFAALLIAGLALAKPIEQFFLKKYYFYYELSGRSPAALFDPLSDLPDVRRAFSPYQKIDIVHYPSPWDPITEGYSTKFVEHPDKPKDYFLFLNGDRQFGSNFEELYHEWFAHVPIIASGRVPKRVLVMGGGDGILHRELNKYAGIEHITHVDIDARLVELARTDPMMTAINEKALEDPRNTIILADAFKFIREDRGEPYDAVFLDFPVVRDYNLSRLFSREFYQFVRARLARDGFLVLDAPRLWLWTAEQEDGTQRWYPAGTWGVLSNTLRHAGFETIVPFYSNLEADNPQAFELLARSERLQEAIAASHGGLESEEAQREWIENYLGRLWRLRIGFLYVRKDVDYGPYPYVDFGIKTHMMNPERFALAFPVQLEPSSEADLDQVNSILRPRLPRGDFGDIRASW